MTDVKDEAPEETNPAVAPRVMDPSEVDTSRFVTDLRPSDVLLGRGTGPNNNQGNVAFREAVEKLKTDYVSTPSRKAKNRIVRKTVEAVKAKNGRFLSKLRKSEIKMLGLPYKDAYEIASDEVAIEKTKQALRYVCYKKDAPSRSDSPDSLERPTKMVKSEHGTLSDAALTSNMSKPAAAGSFAGLPVNFREAGLRSDAFAPGLGMIGTARAASGSFQPAAIGSYPSMVNSNELQSLSSSSPLLAAGASDRLLSSNPSSLLASQNQLQALYGSQQLLGSSLSGIPGVSTNGRLPYPPMNLPGAGANDPSPVSLPHIRTQQMINAIKDEQLLVMLRDKQMRDELALRQERAAAMAVAMRQQRNPDVAVLQQQQEEELRRLRGYLGR